MDGRREQLRRWLQHLDSGSMLYLAVRNGPFISSKEIFLNESDYVVLHGIDGTEEALSAEQLEESLLGRWAHWEEDPRYPPP